MMTLDFGVAVVDLSQVNAGLEKKKAHRALAGAR